MDQAVNFFFVFFFFFFFFFFPPASRAAAPVVICNPKHGAALNLNPAVFNQGKSLMGTWGGDSVPDRDYPKYGKLLASGPLRECAVSCPSPIRWPRPTRRCRTSPPARSAAR